MRSSVINVHLAFCAFLFFEANAAPPVTLNQVQKAAAFKEKYTVFDDVKQLGSVEGGLTRKEVAEALAQKGIVLSEEDLGKAMSAADVKMSGVIGRNEYKRLMTLVESFTAYDKDMDGFLSEEEFLSAMRKYGKVLDKSLVPTVRKMWKIPADGKFHIIVFVQLLAFEFFKG